MRYIDVNHSIEFYCEFLAAFDRVTKIVSIDGAVGNKRPNYYASASIVRRIVGRRKTSVGDHKRK